MSYSLVKLQVQDIEEQLHRRYMLGTDPLAQLFSLRGLEQISEQFNQSPDLPPWEQRSLAEKLATAETQLQAIEVIAQLANLLEETEEYRN